MAYRVGRNIILDLSAPSAYSWLIPIHEGVFRRRSADGVGTAAPALVFRKHESGRSRVTVRPYYEGLPLCRLDAVRMKVAKAAGSGEVNASRPSPEAWSREPKSPRWSAERRARFR